MDSESKNNSGKVEEKDLDLTVSQLVIQRLTKEYLMAHPKDPYNNLEYIDTLDDSVGAALKEYVYRNTIIEMENAFRPGYPQPEKYAFLVKEQEEYIKDMPFMQGLKPEEMNAQYKLWIDTTESFNFFIKKKTKNI